MLGFNLFALRKAKIVCNFGLSECRSIKLFATSISGTYILLFPELSVSAVKLLRQVFLV